MKILPDWLKSGVDFEIFFAQVLAPAFLMGLFAQANALATTVEESLEIMTFVNLLCILVLFIQFHTRRKL